MGTYSLSCNMEIAISQAKMRHDDDDDDDDDYNDGNEDVKTVTSTIYCLFPMFQPLF